MRQVEQHCQDFSALPAANLCSEGRLPDATIGSAGFAKVSRITQDFAQTITPEPSRQPRITSVRQTVPIILVLSNKTVVSITWAGR